MGRDLIRWESQSVTRADTETGRRHRDHGAMGTSVMLFARLRVDDRAFWFLGPATYVSHEVELPHGGDLAASPPVPGDLFAAFAAVLSRARR